MPRLRQLHHGNYPSSGYINEEIESLIRYINAAELGNYTLGELLRTIFNEDGEWRGPVEIRLDSVAGLQYRVGDYAVASDGWQSIAPLADLRGPAGQNIGNVEGPLFYNKRTIELTGTTSTVQYLPQESATETIAVYKNGLLLAEETDQATAAEYTYDAATGVITLAAAGTSGDKITAYMIRSQAVTNYRREDIEIMGATSVVAFVHTEDERLLVFRNGILQEIDGAGDLVSSPATNTLTFSSPLSIGEVVTVITVENESLKTVGGLMLEDEYTDGNGKIDWTTIAVDDGEIAQAKVSGLVSTLAVKGNLTLGASTPSAPNSGDLWIDTNRTPNQLKFYDGTQWIATSPESALPSFTNANANQYVRVNGTGTGLEYGNVDLTSVVPKTYMGAANGVASLDADAKLPAGQLPEIFATRTLSFYSRHEDGANTISNKTYFLGYVWKSRLRIDGIAHKLSSGTCTVQISVDGVTVGNQFNVDSTLSSENLPTTIEVDGTTNARRLELVVTNNSAGNLLEVGLAVASLSV